eukprot:970179-Amphidinium_carterae.1
MLDKTKRLRAWVNSHRFFLLLHSATLVRPCVVPKHEPIICTSDHQWLNGEGQSSSILVRDDS